MNILITLKKSVLGFLTGLAAVIVMGLVESISGYKPTICSATVTENCTPAFLANVWLGIVPVVSGVLVGVANWLKNRNKT